MNINIFFNWILISSFMACILILLILGIQLVFRNYLSPFWQYALWFIFILKLAVPFGPGSIASIFNLVKINGNQFSSYSLDIPGLNENFTNIFSSMITGRNNGLPLENKPLQNTSGNTSGSNSNMNFIGHFGLIWFTGVILLVFYTVWIHIFYGFKIKKNFIYINSGKILEIWNECKKELKINKAIGIYYGNAINIPSIYGLFHPKLLMPADLENNFNYNELRYIFMHEIFHYKRKDILINWLINLFQILHWFNPLIWYAFYRMKNDAEAACDSRVLSRIEPVERRNYALIIIRMLERISGSFLPNPAMASIAVGPGQIKWRLKKIMFFKAHNRIINLILLGIFMILSFVTLTSALAPGQKLASEIESYYSTSKSRNDAMKRLLAAARIARYNRDVIRTAGRIIPRADYKSMPVTWIAEIAAKADHEVPRLKDLLEISVTYGGDVTEIISLASRAASNTICDKDLIKRIDYYKDESETISIEDALYLMSTRSQQKEESKDLLIKNESKFYMKF